MVDQNFFPLSRTITLQELAQIGECSINNDTYSQKIIHGVAPLEVANAQEITFLSNPKYVTFLLQSQAGACILSEKNLSNAPKNMALLISKNPYASYAKIATAFHPEDAVIAEISANSTIDKSAKIGKNCQIMPYSFIGPNVTIGDGSYIGTNVFIGKGVTIGKNCRINHGVTLSNCLLGNNILIHPSANIGQDGFGFASESGVHIKVPQLGRVIIADDVEIGAGTSIDRGAGPDTIIGQGTKIDNLVQIGHNVQIGRGCIIVSQVGIAGSTKIGDYVVLGGQVGVAGHLNIGNMVNVAAQSGIAKNVADREIIGGSPALPIKTWHRQTIALKKLSQRKGESGE